MKPTAKILRLVPPAARPKDTADCLRSLLSDPTVIGVAYVAIKTRREYSVGVAGAAKDNLTLTRGALALLDSELEKLITGGR